MADKELTKEEKKLQQKEARRTYMREYMSNRRKTDPEFAEKQKEAVRKNMHRRYETDEEFRKKKNEVCKDIYRRQREAYKLLKSMNISVN